MAIKLIANYSKRLGLPGYSSHQFEVSIETEISNTSELPFETERLYGSLQAAVDAQIQQVGFVPDEHYGSQVTQRPALGASCSQMISNIIRETNTACKYSRDLCCNRSRMEVLGKATVAHPGTGRKGRAG